MKRLSKVVALITLLSLGLGLNAQQVFKVIATKGAVSGKKGRSSLAIKSGFALERKDVLIVGQNGYVGLIHNSGKTLELKTPGTYKVQDLAAKVEGTNTSFSTQYSQHVFTSMKDNGSGINNRSTGSVSRRRAAKPIDIFANSSYQVVDNEATVVWKKNDNVTDYQVVVMNSGYNPIDTLYTQDTSIVVSFDTYKVEDGILRVKINKKGVDNYDSKIVEIKKADDALSTEAKSMLETKSESALDAFMKASYFEQNNLFEEAVEYYKLSINLEPGVDMYKESYKGYLASLGLAGHYTE